MAIESIYKHSSEFRALLDSTGLDFKRIGNKYGGASWQISLPSGVLITVTDNVTAWCRGYLYGKSLNKG